MKSEDRLRENIRDTCGLFVTIIHSRVYLLHQTAKEFLVRDAKLLTTNYINPELEWKHIILPQESHKTLAEICIFYLLLSSAYDGAILEEHEPQPTNNRILFDYSANYWATHLRDSHIKISEAMAQSILRLCDVNSRLYEHWFAAYWKRTSNTTFPEQFTTLMVLSYFGLDAMVKMVLSTLVDDNELNARDGTYGRSALAWAAGNGFGDVVKLLARGRRSWRRKLYLLLFGNPSEINAVDIFGRTPLLHAIWNGSVTVVKTLLKAGARLDVTDNIGGTPLFYAVTCRREAIVKLLLEHGATTISEDEMVTKLFFSAVEKGDAQVVKLVLDSGFDIESRGSENQTALLLASKTGHMEIVQFLLDQGADIETEDKNGHTPLHSSIINGNVDLVQLFLNNGAYFNLLDIKSQTPLLLALELSGRDTLQVVFDMYGANMEVKDGWGHTPLHLAIIYGYVALVEFFLDNGADINIADMNKRTPLHYAAKSGNVAVVRFLLNKEADVNSVDLIRRTPLSYAVGSGNTKLIHLLLDGGADSSLLDRHERKSYLEILMTKRRRNSTVYPLTP